MPKKDINMLVIKSNVTVLVAMNLLIKKEKAHNFQIKKLNYPFSIQIRPSFLVGLKFKMGKGNLLKKTYLKNNCKKEYFRNIPTAE